MKFYIAYDPTGDVSDCFTKFAPAKALAKTLTGYVNMVDVPVTAESIRVLLANKGGYATDSNVAFETPSAQVKY